MIFKIKKAAALVLSIMILAGLTSCAGLQQDIKPLDIQVVEEKDRSFNFSIKEYIEKYNEYYRAEFGEDYLTASDDLLTYGFTEDETVWTLPVLAISATDKKHYVDKITLSFDWHSYSDALHEKFDTMCFYAIKTMLPDMTDEEIVKLCSRAVDEGYRNTQDRGNAVPYALYYKDSIGLTTRFAIGESQHLCIVPVNAKAIKEYRKKGVKIISIEE